MVSERETFDRSGPLHLTCVDWNNVHHRRSVAACLVQGVYILSRDNLKKRKGRQALAPPWWKTFGFQLKSTLVDKVDNSIFGAIFEYKPSPSSGKHSADGPCFVVAFRGTLIQWETVAQDIKLNVELIWRKQHLSSRRETAMQEVENLVATAGDSKAVWLAGHSQGSAIALLVGKNMAKKGYYLKSFLFNPPYASVPIEKIKSKIWKRAFQLAKSGLCAATALAKQSQEQLKQSADSFAALSLWVPQLFVNKADCVCSGYIGYFEHGKWMRKFRLEGIHKIASRYSVILLFMSENGTQAEPLHLIPSANLSINSKPPKCLLRAHRLSEWWKLDLELESEVYKYER